MKKKKHDFRNYGWEQKAGKEEIIKHRTDYFASLYLEEKQDRPTLDNLGFNAIGEEAARWLEREFEEDEIIDAVFALAGDKALGPDGFPMAFLQRFWYVLKDDILAFMEEQHQRVKLSRGLGASFTALICKNEGELGQSYRQLLQDPS